MSYTHLTIEERSKIEILHREGYPVNQIATLLNRHRSTIYCELGRCNSGAYQASTAHMNAENKGQSKGRKAKYTYELIQAIQSKLLLTWSPEQIVGRDYQGKLSFKTIYNWIYQGILQISLDVLRQKGKRRKTPETRGEFNIGTSITQRPKVVKNRKEFGHWELDTMVSSRGKSKGCLGTFAERKSRFYLALLMTNRSKDAMQGAVDSLLEVLPIEALKSFTSDRGKNLLVTRR